MKRKTVLRLLCVSIVSAMLISTPCMALAQEIKTAIYNGEQIEVIIDGDYVILPDEERILLEEFTGEFIETDEETPSADDEDTEEKGGTDAEEETSKEDGVTEEEGETGKEDSGTEGEGETGKEDNGTGEEEEPDKEDSGTNGGGEENDKGEAETREEQEPSKDSLSNEAEGESGNEDTVTSDRKESEEEKGDTFFRTPSVTAGTGFYVKELTETYHLTFREEFKDTVSEIEEEFLAEVKQISIEEVEKERVSRLTKNLLFPEEKSAEETEEDKTVFTNWQDVLAVYLLEENKDGTQVYEMDASDKEGIAAVFGRMNHGVMEEDKVVVTAKTIEDYKAERRSLSEADCAFLDRYTSQNCALLCASATGIQGFITGSLGEGVSRERAQVVEAAYSLVGKIPYYYGGKSSVIGWDLRWGRPDFVTASGVLKTGTVQDYGLDCSGFVTWAFVNGYENQNAAGYIGHGTTSQWMSCDSVSEEEALPGDLVFLNGPEAVGPDNHVGIVAGHNDDGKLVVIHCNGSDNGVVVESAYGAGFRYVRRPEIFEK